MKMRALDSFFASEVGQVHSGQEFAISSRDRGQEFAKRKLAEIVEEGEMDGNSERQKSEPPPKNKAEPKPDNKSATKG